jgi:hypothetical protein
MADWGAPGGVTDWNPAGNAGDNQWNDAPTDTGNTDYNADNGEGVANGFDDGGANGFEVSTGEDRPRGGGGSCFNCGQEG